MKGAVFLPRPGDPAPYGSSRLIRSDQRNRPVTSPSYLSSSADPADPRKLVHPPRPLFLLLASALLVSACSRAGEDSAPVTQVVARVNGTEITIHQLQFAMARAGDSGGRAQVLDTLIDQELMAQQALQEALDRNPEVLRALEAQRTRTLAQAWSEQRLAKLVDPGAVEIRRFYDAHPELFSERKAYEFDELSLAEDAVPIDELRARAGSAGDISGVARWLDDRSVAFGRRRSTQTADALPMEVAREFHAMRIGTIAVIAAPRAIQVVQLRATQPQPLRLEQASPIIARYLRGQRRRTVLHNDLAELRGKSRIERLGEFAAGDAGASH